MSTLGTSQFNLNTLKVYPNPVVNILSISYDKSIDLITVYDLSGRMVKQVLPNKTDVQVDMSDLAASMYVVIVRANGKQTEIKVIKK
jgi:hypothetical protein